MKCRGLVVGAMLWLAAMVVAPPVVAGDLNPPGPLAPTMKTLNQIPPTWDQKLPANDGPLVNNAPDTCNSSRFKCVLDGAAVLDKETGLVWERWPGSGVNTNAWVDAIYNCFTSSKGGRKGWRLPTIEELASLVDPAVFSAIRLPEGHPFLDVQSNYYWSATTHATNTANAWGVHFGGGSMTGSLAKTINYNWWCVRGGRGNDGQ